MVPQNIRWQMMTMATVTIITIVTMMTMMMIMTSPWQSKPRREWQQGEVPLARRRQGRWRRWWWSWRSCPGTTSSTLSPGRIGDEKVVTMIHSRLKVSCCASCVKPIWAAGPIEFVGEEWKSGLVNIWFLQKYYGEANICQYLSIFIGEETDLEFVKSFTPAGSKYQICGGGVEKWTWWTYQSCQIVSHIVKYCHTS